MRCVVRTSLMRPARKRCKRTSAGQAQASNSDWESATDPESSLMQHADGHTHLSYKVGASVDLETGIIAIEERQDHPSLQGERERVPVVF